MGNCVSLSIPCDQWMNKISQWVNVKTDYIHNLEKNLTSLETTMEELKARRDDLSRRVTREENRGLQRLAEIQVWLTRSETIENRVNDLLSARNVELQRLCICGFCSTDLKSSYRYGKRVFLILKEVEKLKCSGVFEVVAEKSQASEIEERPLQPTIVGQETMLEKAWNHLMEDGTDIMGFYGMGGVGKTTLLTQINNKFSNMRRGFDFVIWVVVSKDFRVKKIRDEIALKVGIGGGEWNQKGESQKGIHLYNFLRKKSFVLLLDDIWEKVDLVEIGMPFPTKQNRCKVVFTTRSQDVCAQMGVQNPMEVKCLTAFDLFQKKVGQTTLRSDPEIPNLARIVAKKCSSLPLALNVIGETMSCKRTIQEWRHAIDVLTSYAVEFSGMKEKILPLLKYSYDNLKGEQIKLCLLYCALFSEDDRIHKDKLIEYWIGEGIIDGSGGIEMAENKGYDIIGGLVRASLLMEEVYPPGMDIVCMHDVVREMALWIASDLGTEKEAFIVQSFSGLYGIPKVENWNVVRRMSLMDNKIHHLLGSPECLKLTTLLLQKANLEIISSEFFKFMPKLVVLDLSHNTIFYVLPDGISQVVSLQYLNLSNTDIHHLPRGLQELKKLFHLDLEETRNLSSIAGISSLHSLKVLRLTGSRFSWDLDTLEELEILDHLEILTMGINPHPCLEKFLRSHRLTSCTRSLVISGSYLESFGISLPVTMDNLRHVDIRNCTIPEIKMAKEGKTVSPLHNPNNLCFLSLSKVFILNCKCLKELTLLMFAPNLRSLDVSYANELEDIVNKEKACKGSKIVPFPKLIDLSLNRLPQLKNIYWSPLPFPCLQQIKISRCPKLKKLPLDSESGTLGENGLIIRYTEKIWIDGVDWEDEATKTRFLSSCKAV